MSSRGAGGGRQEPRGDNRLCGVYYGIVTQNQHDENLARVKVRFPWLPGGDQDQSTWAPLAVPMIGAEWGTYTLPEVDDTVFVVFLDGDINHPVVIGGMWNKVDEPPEVNENGNNDFRFIQSRSGHRLLFDDSDSTKAVLTDKTNGNYVGCGTFSEGGDGPNKMKLEAPSEINGSASKGVAVCSLEGTLNIWCPNGKLEVKSSHVEITAGSKADVKAGKDIKLESGMQAKLESSAPGKYEGSKVKIN